MLGIGKVIKIEGTVAQLSQHQLVRDGAYYEFVTIDADNGQSYKIKRLAAGADVNQDLFVGNHLVLHILPFRSLLTALLTRNVILATETERGVSVGIRLSTQISAFLGAAAVFGFLSVVYLAIMTFIMISMYMSRATLYGEPMDSFWLTWILWTVPVWPFAHSLFVLAAIMVKVNGIKHKLIGSGRTQTLPDGRVLREL
ncbi:hypothetical protein [Rhizobium rhizogenes]|uniref:hypothetical protein n=1 Tax=Rhizobium rhizogenes TaxID=359 RepID=UPI001294FFB3|nr:hypothetical protein [Rhizobium rhizogenes]MQB34722.1 hypothetical protein [Rhizobium rhizogenes]